MRWIQGMAVGALSLALAACSSSPTGRQQLTLVSDQQLNQMGAQTFEQYQQELPTVGGATLSYVQCVSNAIVAELPSSDLAPSWQVKVFDDPSANAFALPGGYIGVNTGLLDIASTQDQLAAVIGHEVSHVLARHANERVSTQQATQLGLSVIQTAAGLQGPQGDTLMGALGAGAQFGILLPFSRSHESEADTLGIQLMADAGFDPRASVTLWEKMSQAGGSQPPAWMSTHPSNSQRIAGLKASMNEAVPRFEQARRAGKTPSCGRS
ncbi:M48 family metallopeptidase [Halomonas sp. YLGW01]|uniref:M48 family metallopeptidase n=1 Tax=Halomonas sp. YLGW01 TaxID=2773308 RepID=UPI001785E99E|nr:M48 family metallopeptidase [Halomonas sp. YLGW01]